MQTFIALLRGINVSGKNPIKMDALRLSLEQLGYANVRTYVQSGNVVFCSTEHREETLQNQIASAIQSDFGLAVPVLVIEAQRFKRLVEGNPLVADTRHTPAFLHITFTGPWPEAPDYPAIMAKAQTGEEAVLGKNAVYLYCPGGYGNTKLTNAFLESKLRTTATTRNLNTCNALVAMVEG